MKRIGCYLLFLILILPQCAQKKIIKKRVSFQPTTFISPVPPPLTIWIHGTQFFRNPIYYSVFNSSACLKQANLIDPYYQLHQIAQTLSDSSPLFDFDNFYIFGWSGRLNALERQEAATVLYNNLCILVEEYEKTYGQKPTIRILAHSHGGNLALNLAEHYSEENPLTIEQLILLACPVQATTKHLTHSIMFRHIYAFYSSLDMIQRLAPQMYTYQTESGKIQSILKIPPLSEQRFPSQPNLAQAKVKINGRALFHTEFTGIRFLKTLATLLTVVEPPLTPAEEPYQQLIAIETISNPIRHRLKKIVIT